MGMIKEFKDFAMKGNVMGIAAGIVIGAAFGKIVSSLVGDVVMPPIGLLLGNVEFSSLAYTLKEATESSPAVAIKYGVFSKTVIDFVIVAFAIFLVVKQMNRLKKPAPVATTKDCPHCLMSVPLKATRCGHCTSELKAGRSKPSGVHKEVNREGSRIEFGRQCTVNQPEPKERKVPEVSSSVFSPPSASAGPWMVADEGWFQSSTVFVSQRMT